MEELEALEFCSNDEEKMELELPFAVIISPTEEAQSEDSILSDPLALGNEEEATQPLLKKEQPATTIPLKTASIQPASKSSEKVKTIFAAVCPKCNVTFANSAALQDHNAVCKAPLAVRPHTCDYCKMSFSHTATLAKHISFLHRNVSTQKQFNKGWLVDLHCCEHCGAHFSTPDFLEAHLQAKHARSGKNLPRKRNKKVKKDSSGDTELRVNIEQPAINAEKLETDTPTPLCSQLSKNDADIVPSKSSKMESKKNNPNVSTLLKNDLLEHCTDEVSSNNIRTRQQKKIPDVKKTHRCNTCGNSFLTSGFLARHMGTHFGERWFECSICHSTFLECSHLEAHKLRHRKQLYKCDFCGDTFAEKYTLKVHLQSHRPELTQVCKLCNSIFTTVKDLKHHKRHHVRENFRCDVCGMELRSWQGLMLHLRARPVTNFESEYTNCLACVECRVVFITSCGQQKHFRTLHSMGNIENESSKDNTLQEKQPTLDIESIQSEIKNEIVIEEMKFEEEEERIESEESYRLDQCFKETSVHNECTDCNK